MARHFRMQSFDLYDKLGMKKKKYRVQTSASSSSSNSNSLAENSTFSASFSLTEQKNFRTKSAETVKRSENSPVNFEKQLPRPDFLIRALPVHEKRFVPFNDNPSVSSRHRSVNTPKFNLYSDRKPEVVNITLRVTDLNYAPIEKNTRKGLVPFEKTIGRKPQSLEPPVPDKLEIVDYSPLVKNVMVPNIGKNSSRTVESDVPLFMVNPGDRGENISFKSLKMNNYKNRDLLSLSSGFGSHIIERQPYPIPIKGRCPKIVKVLKAKLKMT